MQTAYAENRTGREKGSPAMFSVSVTVEVHLTIDGEYRDADTGLIYLRARWYSPDIGRFITMDSYEGDPNDPLSLHKYTFSSNDPVNKSDPSGNITFPTESKQLSSPYGWRIDPFTKQRAFHHAVDIWQKGTSWRVYSILDGQVVKIGRTRNGANYIWIQTNHFIHGYYHTYTTTKNLGASVAEGEWIGMTDMSGRSTNPHLHFRIHSAGNENEFINPWPMIRNAPLPGEHQTLFRRIMNKVTTILSGI